MTEYTENIDDEAKKAAFAKRFIESCILRYKIFIDTCSLLDPYAPTFWATAEPFLEQYGKYIIVPKRCIEEVDKLINNKDADLAERADKVHIRLYDLAMRRLVQVHGERTDGFADSVFLSVGAKFRMQYDMMLITQDRTLASEFEALGNSQAVRTSRSIIARRINRYGFLSPFREMLADAGMGAEEYADEVMPPVRVMYSNSASEVLHRGAEDEVSVASKVGA